VLRQVYIFKGKECLYYRHFGKALKEEIFNNIVEELQEDAFGRSGKKVEYHDYYKYRISYITEKDLDLMFLFITGLTDNFENIKKELIKCKKEFLNLFEDILEHKFDAKMFDVFDPTVDSIHRNLRPKISLVGFSGVGKTTITKLIKAEEIPVKHVPTITGDIATIKIGKLHFYLWDFAGQEQFSYLWNNFIKGSDSVLLITDSTLENVEKSKFFLELIKEQAGHAHTAVIGNKQDLPDAMLPAQIEKILGLKTYSMIAKDKGNRDKMIQIIADILEMSAEVSPLLRPLLERDNLMEEAKDTLENEDFEKAAFLFEKISDLCIELGDDSLGSEFYRKSQKIKELFKKATTPEVKAPAPVQPSPEELPATTPEVKAPAPVQPMPEELPATTPEVKAPAPVQPTPEELPATTPEVKAPAPVQPTPEELPATTPEVKVPALVQPSPTEQPLEKIKIKPVQKIPDVVQISIPLKKRGKSKTPTVIKKDAQEPEHLFKPVIPQTKIGIKLNPEDFMIKRRPKSVGDIPKDARDKLKTTPYAHVTNQPQPKAQAPISPVQLPTEIINDTTAQIKKPAVPIISQEPLKQSTPVVTSQHLPVVVPITPQRSIKAIDTSEPIQELRTDVLKETPSTIVEPPQARSILDPQQKSNIEKTLMDLKIKKANISKMGLDYEMKELRGEITAEELDLKKQKLESIEKKINEQIESLEKLL